MKTRRITVAAIEVTVSEPQMFFGPREGESQIAYEMRRWREALEEAAKIIRVLPGVESACITVENEEHCSLCGHLWEEDPAEGPLCCDAAQAEWHAERAP